MKYSETTILLVEDDTNDVLLIQRAFRHARLLNPLQIVGDGEHAIRYLTGQGSYADRTTHPMPALVLLDLHMPRMSGLELLQWLREQPQFRLLPVVVLTASDQAPDIHRAYELGADSYLLKPGSFEELVQMARRLNSSWLLVNKGAEKTALA
jgi:CheY-like chemotaxis protein